MELPAAGSEPDRRLVLVANARMPSQRAQSVQLAKAARAFQRSGYGTTVLHAERRDTPAAEARATWRKLLLDFDESEPLPDLCAAPCSDWIDAVPRSLQFLPARMQEWTFGRRATALVRRDHRGALCLARDVEVGHGLRGRPGLALEIHRVPGGRTRRRWLMSAVDGGAGVVAISGGVRDDLLELGVPASRMIVAHDAVDAGLGEALPTRSEARRALGLDVDRPVVLYAGGLLQWKGVEVLVDAARRLHDPLFLIVGGMDADVARLRAYASGLRHVRIDGFQEASRIPTYLAAADMSVVPNRKTPRISSHYTSPLKVFEAMAAGVPLVVSDLPSLRDAIGQVDGQVGGAADGAGDLAVFVEPESAEALAEALSALLADPEERRRLSEEAQAFSLQHTWEARARRILAFMDPGQHGAGAGLPVVNPASPL